MTMMIMVIIDFI